MIAVMLMMLAGGIALTQAVSDPNQVTLRWLRLGGMVGLGVLCAAITAVMLSELRGTMLPFALLAVAAGFVVQLITVQLAKRKVQRIAAAMTFVIATGLIWYVEMQAVGAPPRLQAVGADGSPIATTLPVDANAPLTHLLSSGGTNAVALLILAATGAGLVGGYIMAMLLGHAYLTAGGEMTQKPFARLVILLATLLCIRFVLSALFGGWRFLNEPAEMIPGNAMWNTLMVTARYAVGIFVPGVFTYMVYDCVRRRSNQSATGILYVASVLVIVGEGIALALLESTRLVF